MLNHEGLVQAAVCVEKHGICRQIMTTFFSAIQHIYMKIPLRDTQMWWNRQKTSKRQDSFNKNKYIHCVRINGSAA